MPIQKLPRTVPEEYKQIMLDLDMAEIEHDGLSQEEARLRHEAGRSALMALQSSDVRPSWFSRFEYLLSIGWTWRQAAYIAWASMPSENRDPKTQEELAKKYLNLTSDRAISRWKRNTTIETMIGVMQTWELWGTRGDAFENLVKGVKKSGSDYKFFNHLKLYLEMMRDYVPLNLEASVGSRKAEDGVRAMPEDALEQLEAGAEELDSMMTNSVTDASDMKNGNNAEDGK